MHTQKTLALLLLPVALLSVGCGGGGGQSDPLAMSEDIVGLIKSERFDRLLGYTSDTDQRMFSDMHQRGLLELKENFVKWDGGLADQVKQLDPKDKAEVSSKDKFSGINARKAFALMNGCYRLYNISDMEKRLKADFFLAQHETSLSLEGQGLASFTFLNVYNDQIKVECRRIDGKWYMADLNLRFEKDLRSVPQ